MTTDNSSDQFQTPVDRTQLPTDAMRTWLVAEHLSDPVSVYLIDREEVRRQIRDYFPGGLDAFLNEYEGSGKEPLPAAIEDMPEPKSNRPEPKPKRYSCHCTCGGSLETDTKKDMLK